MSYHTTTIEGFHVSCYPGGFECYASYKASWNRLEELLKGQPLICSTAPYAEPSTYPVPAHVVSRIDSWAKAHGYVYRKPKERKRVNP